MNLFPCFVAPSFARRLAYSLALLLLVPAALPAQAAYRCDIAGNTCDQGEAYSECWDKLDKLEETAPAQRPYSDKRCLLSPNGNLYNAAATYNCGGVGCAGDFGRFSFTEKCSARDLQDKWKHDGNPATVDKVCHNGCSYEAAIFLDPQQSFTYYAPTGDACKVGDAPPPQPCDANGLCEPDTDKDGFPDSIDAFPTDPTEWKDTDGDGIGDNGDIAPNDPRNGDDGSKPPDGSDPTPPGQGPGDESDNQSSGGGTCSQAPTCSGDGIQCNILYQTWATRCAAERTADNTGDGDGGPGSGPGTVAGGADCATPFVCTGGDPIACAALNEQHKARCTFEKRFEGDDDYGQSRTASEAWGLGGSDLGDAIDDQGWLSNRSCPAETLRIGGEEVDWRPLCDGADVLGFYVMFLGFLHSARIIGRSVSGGG